MVNWSRLVRRGALAAALIAAAFTLYTNVLRSRYGFDFEGIWRAGGAVLAGHSPYLSANADLLLRHGNAFITPPPLAVLAVPFSLLPFAWAIGLWNVGCAICVIVGLRLLHVRDWRIHAVVLASFPFISSLILGQPDALFFLLAAAGWRWRDSSLGAVSVGALIALKLLAWPLAVWLIVTRRFRGCAIAITTAVGLLVATWALIDFRGLLAYPRLLAADAQAFEARCHSIATAVLRLGAPGSAAAAITVGVALGAALAVVRAGRGSELAWFAGAVLFGLLASPLVWAHYLLLLFVPLAVARRRLSPLWLIAGVLFWLSPVENAAGWQVDLVLIASILLVVAAVRPVPDRRERTSAAGVEGRPGREAHPPQALLGPASRSGFGMPTT